MTDEQLHEGLQADAERFMHVWKRWLNASESCSDIPEYWESLTRIVQELRTRQLLAVSSRPRIGEMALRLQNGSPVLLISGGEVVFTESALDFACHCKTWFVSTYGDMAVQNVQIMRVVG